MMSDCESENHGIDLTPDFPPPAVAVESTIPVLRKWPLVVGVCALYLGSAGLTFGYVVLAALPNKETKDVYTFWQGLSELVLYFIVIPAVIAGAIFVVAGTILVSVWGERSRRKKLDSMQNVERSSLNRLGRLRITLLGIRVPFCLAVVGLIQLTETVFLWGYQSTVEMPLHMPFADYGQGPLARIPENPLYFAIFGVGVWCISGARGGRIGVMVFQGYLFLHVLYWMSKGYLLVGNNGEIGIESNKVGLSALVFSGSFLIALSARTWRTE